MVLCCGFVGRGASFTVHPVPSVLSVLRFNCGSKLQRRTVVSDACQPELFLARVLHSDQHRVVLFLRMVCRNAAACHPGAAAASCSSSTGLFFFFCALPEKVVSLRSCISDQKKKKTNLSKVSPHGTSCPCQP